MRHYTDETIEYRIMFLWTEHWVFFILNLLEFLYKIFTEQ